MVVMSFLLTCGVPRVELHRQQVHALEILVGHAAIAVAVSLAEGAEQHLLGHARNHERARLSNCSQRSVAIAE